VKNRFHSFKWVNLYRYNVAQYQLGEMFRRGLFTDSVELFLARKYLNLATEQGHTEAVARLSEMDRERLHCAFCGADDAPNECALCHRVRYCNLECSHAHLRHGGGFKVPARGAAEDPHEHTCKRTYGRSGKLFYMLNRTLAPRGGGSPPRSGRRRRNTSTHATGRFRAARSGQE
jgi:hypothetical protein